VLLTLLFGLCGIVLIVGVESQPRFKNNPMLRIGADFFGAALVVIALIFLVAFIT